MTLKPFDIKKLDMWQRIYGDGQSETKKRGKTEAEMSNKLVISHPDLIQPVELEAQQVKPFSNEQWNNNMLTHWLLDFTAVW